MIEQIFEYINVLSQGNEMIAGALTLALSGSVLWLIKATPVTFANIIKAQCITTITLNNSSWEKEKTFIKVGAFLTKLTSDAGSRTLTLDSIWLEGKDTMVLTLGYGKHFFFYRKRFMWLTRAKLDSSGSERQKEEILLSTFGRSHKIFYDLVEDNRPPEDRSAINFSEFKNDDWVVVEKVKKHGLDKLALNPEVKDMFINEINHFKESESLYERLCLPYKLSLILHGMSGSGKSRVIRAIASDYSMNICNVNLSEMTDKTFKSAISSAPDNSIIVIEDFDSCGAVNKRKNVTGVEDTLSPSLTKDSDFSFLTLSGILNALDGIASLDNKIIMFTTNCIDNIDAAILRSGRIDKIIELPLINGDVVKDYFVGLYGKSFDIDCPDLQAKDVNRIVFASKSDVEIAKKLMTEVVRSRRL